jgi:predicted lipoprotein with Yx(FWY)xxD motif
MIPRKPFTLLGTAAVIPLAALAVVGCGGGSSSANAAPAHPKTAPHPKAAARHVPTVRVATTRLGKILVDSRGRTLYLFTKDSGTKSACSGACATAWPPLRASGKATAGSGAKASLVRTTARSQVTYNGHPLYTFIKDTKSGATNGEGLTAFGGHWFAVSPAGKQISSHSSKSPSGSSSAPAPAPAPAAPAPAPAAPAPAAPPAPKASPPANNGIPQNGGGDGDSDNNGGPSDGDGNL